MNNLLRFLILTLLATTAAAQVTTSERFGFRSANDPAYSGGITCGTETTTGTSDHTALQAALAAANTAGGGTVYVPACETGEWYWFSTAITIPSNVTLRCQRGATFKSDTDATPSLAYTVTGATGFVGFYGVTNAGIDGCTIDSTSVGTASNQANPIEVRDSTPSTLGSGTRSSFITVQNNSVAADAHAAGPYLIWVREADNVRILNNNVDGQQTTFVTPSDQQGIETIAVTKVEISGNHVQNIGRSGILIGAYSDVDQSGYFTSDVVVSGNIISVSGGGVNGSAIAVEAADAGTNIAYLSNLTVSGNAIRDPWQTGIRVGIGGTVTAGEDMFRSVVISNNTVSMAELSQDPFGLWLQFGSANPDIMGFVVAGNSFHGGSGDANEQTCIRLQYAKDVQFIGNRCDGGDATTASLYSVFITPSEATSNVSWVGNYFGQSTGSSWYVGGGDDYTLSGNVFEDFNRTTDSLPTINVAAQTNRWVVTGNKFIKDPNNASNEGYLVDGTTSHLADWTWANNSRAWTPSFNRQADGIWDGTCSTTPGNAPQFGCVTIAVGAATATVTNTKVRSGSRVYLNQFSGDPIAAKAAAGSGSFVVTLSGNCATADCTFYYEVMQ